MYIKYLVLCLPFLPHTVSAQIPDQIVTCSGAFDCNLCSLVATFQNVISFLMTIVVFFCVFLILYVGFRLVTSLGNSEALAEAKKLFVSAVIGFIIILAAWTLIDTLLKVLVSNSNFGVWYTISADDCGGVRDVADPVGVVDLAVVEGGDGGDTLTGGTGGDTLGDIAGCSGGSCVPLSTPCKNGCSVAAGLVDAINAMHARAGVSGARVTEAMPPSTTRHKAQCHYNGTCIDYGKAGGMTAAEVSAVINAARSSGLRPVYEVSTQGQKDALVRGGVNAGDILILGSHITAPHFSIYGG